MKFKRGPLPGTSKYPRVIQISVSQDMIELLRREAFGRKLSISSYARTMLIPANAHERLEYLRRTQTEYTTAREARIHAEVKP